MITRSAAARSACPRNQRWPRGVGAWPSPALLFGMVLLAGPTAAQVVAPSLDDLIAKAAREGSLRVTVQLRIEPATANRGSIAAAQDFVIQELAGTAHRVLRRFTTIPYLGLEVSADALRRLAASPTVIGIREDRLRMPLVPGSP